MARYGDYVLGAEDLGLFENFAANFGESQTVGGGIEVFEASSVLNRLEGYATDTGLSQGEVDRLADLVIVQAFFKGNDQGSRDVVAVELFEGVDAYAAEVGATELHEGFTLE